MNESTDKSYEIFQYLASQNALTKDLKKAMSDVPMTSNEARYLVDLYYQMQGNRIRMNNQIKAIHREAKKSEVPPEPHAMLKFFFGEARIIEKNLKEALATYAGYHPMSWFFLQTHGIGPVLAAGLCAYIDPRIAKTAGAVWRYAGLDPTVVWEKGEKRPWNANLKVLCWRIGDSFVKHSSNEKSFYGRIYRERKDYEITRNESGGNREAAALALKTKNYKENATRKCLESGKLPPGQLDNRARRYAVKLLLSHFLQRWREQLGLPVVDPWPIAHAGHAHVIEPPQIPE